MMEQALLHMWGDYILQNHWMAKTKVKFTRAGWLACLTHCVIYSVPFYLIASWPALIVIFSTHFLIDKFRIGKYIVTLRDWNFDNKNSNWQPIYLSTWLVIIADNVIHVTINYLSIKYL